MHIVQRTQAATCSHLLGWGVKVEVAAPSRHVRAGAHAASIALEGAGAGILRLLVLVGLRALPGLAAVCDTGRQPYVEMYWQYKAAAVIVFLAGTTRHWCKIQSFPITDAATQGRSSDASVQVHPESLGISNRECAQRKRRRTCAEVAVRWVVAVDSRHGAQACAAGQHVRRGGLKLDGAGHRAPYWRTIALRRHIACIQANLAN